MGKHSSVRNIFMQTKTCSFSEQVSVSVLAVGVKIGRTVQLLFPVTTLQSELVNSKENFSAKTVIV